MTEEKSPREILQMMILMVARLIYSSPKVILDTENGKRGKLMSMP